MTSYIEIDDVDEIARLHATLGRKLKPLLKHRSYRRIVYPGSRETKGYFDAEVRFLEDKGQMVFWWFGEKTKEGNAQNFFGHGDPSDGGSLQIELQFNHRLITHDRRQGGVFVRHALTGEVFLAHRGIITRITRIPITLLFEEVQWSIEEVAASHGVSELLLLASMESTSLVRDLSAATTEIRRAADVVRARKIAGLDDSGQGGRGAESGRQSGAPPNILSKYFKEFIGGRVVSTGRRNIVADCYHGAVVHGIAEKAERAAYEIFNSRPVDLVAIKVGKTLVFEVKTSASTQDIYTAIGQLLFHERVVKKMRPAQKLIRVAVLPGRSDDWFVDVLQKHLKISVVVYERRANGDIAFDGLDQLLRH